MKKLTIPKPCCGVCANFLETQQKCKASAGQSYPVIASNLACDGTGFKWWTELALEIEVPDDLYNSITRDWRFNVLTEEGQERVVERREYLKLNPEEDDDD